MARQSPNSVLMHAQRMSTTAAAAGASTRLLVLEKKAFTCWESESYIQARSLLSLFLGLNSTALVCVCVCVLVPFIFVIQRETLHYFSPENKIKSTEHEFPRRVKLGLFLYLTLIEEEERGRGYKTSFSVSMLPLKCLFLIYLS